MLSNVLHDALGPIKQWTWGNGTNSSRAFDLDGKVTQIVSSGTRNYGYDDAFRITGVTDADNAPLSWTYGYDKLDRLTSASMHDLDRFVATLHANYVVLARRWAAGD